MKSIVPFGLGLIMISILSGCATAGYQLKISEYDGHSTAEIWRHTSDKSEMVAGYDLKDFVVVPIYLPEDKPENRIVFVDRDKLDLLSAGDSEYCRQLRTWLVDDHCLSDLACHFPAE